MTGQSFIYDIQLITLILHVVFLWLTFIDRNTTVSEYPTGHLVVSKTTISELLTVIQCQKAHMQQHC